MLYDTRRLKVTDDLGSLALIPYFANVEYRDRELVFNFFDGDGRPRLSFDRTASSKF
jgi:hypothetical protein